jgi:hypothetical protein
MCLTISAIAVLLALGCLRRAVRSAHTSARPYPYFHRTAFEDPALDLVHEQARLERSRS